MYQRDILAYMLSGYSWKKVLFSNSSVLSFTAICETFKMKEEFDLGVCLKKSLLGEKKKRQKKTVFQECDASEKKTFSRLCVSLYLHVEWQILCVS